MFKKLFVICFTFLVAFTGHQALPHKSAASGENDEAIEQARQIVSALVSEQNIPGLTIAVASGRKIVWSEGFGLADLENAVPATSKTRFRVGSISKLFTAAALVRLFEQGRLELDAPVQKYVPAFPQKQFEITSRQLAGHLGGIRHYKRADYVNQKRFETVSDSVKNFQDDPLLHQPGSKYAYSTFGYVLLSAVIEGAAKQDYREYMQTQVFTPLGLKDTVADDNRKVIENRSRFYSKNAEGKISNEVYMDTSDRLAAGGFLSTADDLARFGMSHLNDGFFKPKSRAAIFTSQKISEGKETGVGIGWRIGKDSKGRTIYHHGGDTIGGRAFLIVYPDSKIVIAITSNLSFAKIAEKEAENIAESFIR